MKKKIDLAQLMNKEKKNVKKSTPPAEKSKEEKFVEAAAAPAKAPEPEKTEKASEEKAREPQRTEAPAAERNASAVEPAAPARKIAQEAQQETEDDGKEYVSFMLGGEEYGMDSDCVRQIIKYKKPLDIGLKSDILLGIVNIKDSILPVIDFRKKFRLNEKVSNDGSIIILQVGGTRIGVYVDFLVGISRLVKADIRKIPPFLPEHLLKYIYGIGIKKNGKILIILDQASLFSKDELNELRAIPEYYK